MFVLQASSASLVRVCVEEEEEGNLSESDRLRWAVVAVILSLKKKNP